MTYIQSFGSKPIIDYLVAITPISIAFFVAITGYFQWRTGEKKLRLDLYNRRFDVYRNAVWFQNKLQTSDLKKDRLEFDELREKFWASMMESRFLFDTESGIYQLLYELNIRSYNIVFHKTQFGDLLRPPEHLQSQFESFEADMNWSIHYMSIFADRVSPYLSYRDSLPERMRRKSESNYAVALSVQMAEIERRLGIK